MHKKAPQAVALVCAWLLCVVAWADEYATQWGPQVGTKLPLLDAPDQTGTTRTFGDLAGEQGLLLFINRSADW